MRSVFYAVSIIAAAVLIGYIIIFWGWFRISRSSSTDTRNPECHVHEANRISFPEKPGYDLKRMIESFFVTHQNYRFSDSLYTEEEGGHLYSCYCCCIKTDDYKEIYFHKLRKRFT